MVADTHTLPVRFTTQTPYPLPAQKFMIPAAWRRYQLSQLVNKALALTQPIPFDFLVRGELLRGSLADWCNERGVGMEETLEIEYIESLMPPQRVASIPHDDWISSVSCQIPGHFVTASYDGLIRVFDSSQSLIHTITGHSASVTSVSVVPQHSDSPASVHSNSETRLLASASHDGTVRLISFSTSQPSSRTLATLHLHTSPISSVSASPTGTQLLTAGWDSLVGLWDTTVPASDEVPAPLTSGQEERRKRRRVIKDGAEDEGDERPRRKAPLAVLKSHAGRVMDSAFAPTDRGRAFSCGLDSTVRSWDLESGVCVHTLTAPEKPFLALTPLGAPHLLAAAAADRTVVVYDTRVFATAGSTPLVASLPHTSMPACLAASPAQGNGNENHVASGAFDGVVRLWDVRSVRGALASFRAGANAGAESRGDAKVLGLDWSRGVLAVGGEAGLDIWRVQDGASKE